MDQPFPNDNLRFLSEKWVERLQAMSIDRQFYLCACLTELMLETSDDLLHVHRDMGAEVKLINSIYKSASFVVGFCKQHYPFDVDFEYLMPPHDKLLSPDCDGVLPGLPSTRESYFCHSIFQSLAGLTLYTRSPEVNDSPDPVYHLNLFFNSLISANEYFHELGKTAKSLGEFDAISTLQKSLVEFFDVFSYETHPDFLSLHKSFRLQIETSWNRLMSDFTCFKGT